MDPERKALAITAYEGERTIDRRFRSMAERVPQIVLEVVGSEGPITDAHRGQIMRRVDIELDTIYPVSRGGPCVIEGDIQEMTNRVRSRAVKAAMAPIVAGIKRLDPGLWEVIRERSTSD